MKDKEFLKWRVKLITDITDITDIKDEEIVKGGHILEEDLKFLKGYVITENNSFPDKKITLKNKKDNFKIITKVKWERTRKLTYLKKLNLLNGKYIHTFQSIGIPTFLGVTK